MKIKTFAALLLIISNFFVHAHENEDSEEDQIKRLFNADNNPFCKHYNPETDIFYDSICNYPAEIAYLYFKGKRESDLIPEITFETKEALNEWAARQEKSYMIAYKPGCFPCANLLAAIESKIQNLHDQGKTIFMVNVRKNKDAFSEEKDCWYYEGTPEAWLISNGQIVKKLANCTAQDYFKEFIQEPSTAK